MKLIKTDWWIGAFGYGEKKGLLNFVQFFIYKNQYCHMQNEPNCIWCKNMSLMKWAAMEVN